MPLYRKITFLVYPKFEALDLSGPCSAFNLAKDIYHVNYEIEIVSSTAGMVEDRAGIRIETHPFHDVGLNETVIVVGGPTALIGEIDNETKTFLEESKLRGKQVASVCTGAFLLAEAGILQGRRATTHWRYAGFLQEKYPEIVVDADKIFIKDENIWTSAGMTSGIDLALALIEDDCGTAIAKGVARDLVVYHRRIGGQSQYSDMLEMTPSFGRIRDVLCYAREHLHEPLTIEDLADIACLSLRQFNRVFVSVIGITPAKAIERLRLEEAQPRVEYGRDPLEKIAHDVGFNSLEKMRRSFISVFGRSPQELRRTARSYRTNDS